MAQTNLPAYLQNDTGRNINDVAMLGIGSALPPHISIRGNTFTLVDASGATQAAGNVLDVLIADLSDVVCKQFYAEKWTPDSNEPPLCWSANGLAPSREAIQPQSATCASCPNNVRGSAVSAISGAAIKACRDERWLAILIPSLPDMRFQLRLTPGSFKNWGGFFEKCKGGGVRINQVLTRITFAPQVNGVLVFEPTGYAPEALIALRQQGEAEKAFDVLVGRNDIPIQASLPAPASPPMLAPVGGAPTPAAVLAPFAPPAASPQPTPFMAQPAASASPAGPFASGNGPAPPAPTQKRRSRRTQAEIAADNAQTTLAAPATQPAPAFAQAAPAPVAPFRPQAEGPTNSAFAAPQTQAPGAPFGIQSGVAPNAEIAATLSGLFGKTPGQ